MSSLQTPSPRTIALPLLLSFALLPACGGKKAPVAAAAPAGLDAGPPAVAPDGDWQPPQPGVTTLSTGAPLWIIERPDLPLVSVEVVVPGGKAADPEGQPGLVALTDDLLMRGAGDRDARAFAAAADLLAAEVEAWTGDTSTTFTLYVHSDRLDAGLDLLADALLRPRMEQAELDRLVELAQGDLASATSDPSTVSRWVGDHVWFGAGHPLAHPVQGTPDSLRLATVDAARDSWAARKASGSPTFVVAGDVDTAELTAALEARFASWAAEPAAPVVPLAPVPVADGPLLTFVDNPGASQTMLRVDLPAPSLADDDVAAARLASIALGGTFTSRLNRKLREEKGYTYGARSTLDATPSYGRIVVSTAVQRDVTGPALTDLLAELARVHDDLAAEELDKARGSRRTDMVEMAGSRRALSGSYASLAAEGRPLTSFADALAAEAAVDAAAARAAIAGSRMDGASVVVVGDLAEIRETVQAVLPGDWRQVDAWGQPVTD